MTTPSQLRQTRTHVLLEVSQTSYDEIAKKLRAAGYDHAFDDTGHIGAIDMHGISVILQSKENL